MLNRHGLVAGATGTGKTKTLQLLAEQLSAARRPGLRRRHQGRPLRPQHARASRATRSPRGPPSVGQQWTATGFPVEYYALGGAGHRHPAAGHDVGVRPDAAEQGARPQRHPGVQPRPGLPLRRPGRPAAARPRRPARGRAATSPATRARPTSRSSAASPSATAGVILRELIAFQDQGADAFFGEPEFESARPAPDRPRRPGPDLAWSSCPNLQDRPAVFSTFLMWLLADLFHDLPEVGDVDKPKLVFFFDEAHLLFHDASDAVPRPDRPDRAADPVQGRRGLLRDPEPDRRARRGARPARLPDPAPAAGAHAQRRQGAQGDREHLPDLGVRRPRRGDHQPRHRRGGGDRDERARRPDPGRLDPAARPGVADGSGRPGRDGRAVVQASPRFAKYAAGVDRESAREKLAARLEEGAAQEAAEARAEAEEKARARRTRRRSPGAEARPADARRRRTTTASCTTS